LKNQDELIDMTFNNKRGYKKGNYYTIYIWNQGKRPSSPDEPVCHYYEFWHYYTCILKLAEDDKTGCIEIIGFDGWSVSDVQFLNKVLWKIDGRITFPSKGTLYFSRAKIGLHLYDVKTKEKWDRNLSIIAEVVPNKKKTRYIGSKSDFGLALLSALDEHYGIDF